MAFELTIAAKRAPLTGHGEKAGHSSYTTIEMNGKADRDDVRGLLTTISRVFDEGADTVLLDANDVSTDDPECFPLFTRGLMAIRDSGLDVQMRVRTEAQHERLAALPNSRDWLLALDNAGTGPRRSLHLDGTQHERDA